MLSVTNSTGAKATHWNGRIVVTESAPNGLIILILLAVVIIRVFLVLLYCLLVLVVLRCFLLLVCIFLFDDEIGLVDAI